MHSRGCKGDANVGWLSHALPRAWKITADGSVPEYWQYVKWLLLVALMAMAFRASRQTVYLAFAALFIYLLIDDSISVHELVGARLARLLGFTPWLGLRDVDFGELLMTAIAAVVLFGAIGIAHLGATAEATRRFVRVMMLLIVALAGFGVGVDMLDIILQSEWLSIVEDAGEMAVASLMVAVAYLEARRLRS